MARNSQRTRKHMRELPDKANTFQGLHDWYNAKFKKLGWMVLAKARGDNTKVMAYKEGIDRLLASIEHVLNEYTDTDKQHDLLVLHMNTLVLRDFVAKNI